VFCALVVTAECSVDKLFIHYFHCQSSASGGFDPIPHRGSIPYPAGVLLFSDP